MRLGVGSARVLGLAVGAVAVGLGAGAARGQNVVHTWVGASPGEFTVGGNWSTGVVPGGTTAIVRIDNGAAGNADVVLGSDRTIRMLDVTFGDQLRLGTGVALSIDAGDSGGVPNNTFVDNDGTLALGSGLLRVRGYLQHDGFGAMTLAGGEVVGVRPDDAFGTPADYFANRADLRGYGAVRTNFENYQGVNANVAGQTLYLGNVVGNFGGTMEASNGGRLVIAHGSGFSNSVGTIRANAGSTVEFGGTVINGTIRNNGGTFKSVGGFTKLVNVTVGGGKITFVPDAGVSDPYAAVNDLQLEGTIVNQGDLAFEGVHATNPSFVGVVGTLNLRGGGSVSMNQGTGAANAVRFGDGGGFATAKVVNGRDPVGANPVVAADVHTIRGAGTFEVRLDNRRGGVVENPAGAVAGITFMAPVTNAGAINVNKSATVVGAFEMDAAGNSAFVNEAGGTFAATGAAVNLAGATLTNRGTFAATGGSAVTMGTGTVIRNFGTFELAGGSTLTGSAAFFNGVEGITNSGNFRILDTSSINSSREFRQTDTGTLTFGVSGALHASFTGRGTLGGAITASGGVAGGTVYQVMNGDFRGRFSSAGATGLGSDQAVKVIYQENAVGQRTGVAIQVVPAEKIVADGPVVVPALANDKYHELTANAGEMDVTMGASSLGMALRAAFNADPALAAKIKMRVEANAVVDGEIYAERGPVEMTIAPGASVSAAKYSVSSVSTVNVSGKGDFPFTNDGRAKLGAGSETQYVHQRDGVLTLSSPISEQYNRAQNLLSGDGVYFKDLRGQVWSIIQARFGSVNEDLVTTTTRIIALGGGNIVAVGGGNIVANGGGNLTIAGNNYASGALGDIYGQLLNWTSGSSTRDYAVDAASDILVPFNSRFADSNALFGTVNGIVALGGGNLAGANYDLGAKIIANGGGNLSILDQYQAGIIAVGGANIVANGGGNLAPIVDPSHIVAVGGGNLLAQIGFSAEDLGKSGIVANGGGNIVAMGGRNFNFGIPRGPSGVAGGDAAQAAAAVVPNEDLYQFFVAGDYRQSGLGTTRLLIRGEGDYDQIVVSGLAALDGSLAVELADPAGEGGENPYVPQPGDVFDLMVASSFETVNGFHLVLPGGYAWEYSFADLGNGTGALRLSLPGTVGPIAGDANGDGVIGADDFALIDRGFAMGLGGFENGDFDNDGVVGLEDYLLIDQAFAGQGGGLSAAFLAEREGRFGSGYVAALTAMVPEPSGALIGGVLAAAMGRRRRR